MQKPTITPAKKLRIEMILRDLRARDLVKHIGASRSLIEKLMTGQLGEVSPEMARRINGFFGKRIFPVRAEKRAKSSSVQLSGESISPNTPRKVCPRKVSAPMTPRYETPSAPENSMQGPQAVCPLCQSSRPTMFLSRIADGKMVKVNICAACFSRNGSPDISSAEFDALFDRACDQSNKGGKNL